MSSLFSLRAEPFRYLAGAASGADTTTVMWLVRLWMELARPIDLARNRL
jgi:hypothetical protein